MKKWWIKAESVLCKVVGYIWIAILALFSVDCLLMVVKLLLKLLEVI